MSTLTFLCLSCILMYTHAVPCHENQHCSDCNVTTGFCTTDCVVGFYDQKCRSKCNKNCIDDVCTLSSNGNDNCTKGCVLGYQGSSCNIPCDNPGQNCTACPGGCAGGYCQLGSSCVSGCVDSYYGTDCKSCSGGCKQCNKITGTCTETNATNGCEGGCTSRHIDSGCKDDNCHNGSPHTSVKPLDTGCDQGLYGDHCNKTCRVCVDGYCDQISGMCFRGCNKTKRGCSFSCKVNCSLADCTIDTCSKDSDNGDIHHSINMALLTVLCLFVFCILITVCVCYCRITFSQRAVTVQEEVEYRDEPARERLASMFIRSHHTYCDVNDSEIGPVIVFL